MLSTMIGLLLTMLNLSAPGDVIYVTDGTERGVPEVVLYHEAEGDSAYRCTVTLPIQCYVEII